MIEMVYSGKETEELNEVKVPKNIHQIGDNKSNRKIYIEDYVMTNLKKKPDLDENVKYGVLLGEIKRAKGNTYVFVKGMVESREVIENSIIFNDDIWAAIYKDIKMYFEGFEIVGWFVSVPYTVKNDMTSIQKIHLDNFAGNDKLCYLSDRTENEDGFFSYELGSLKKQSGYYIFYEKNEKMKKYLKQTQGNRGIVVSENTEKKANQDTTLKKVKSKSAGIKKEKVDSPIGEKQHLSFRDLIKQQVNEENNKGFKPGRVAYGISSLLIIALLLSTVVMLNNYGELKSLKASIEEMNGDDSIQVVNEILSSIMPTTAESDESKTNDSVADHITETETKGIAENQTQGSTNDESETVSVQIEANNSQQANEPVETNAPTNVNDDLDDDSDEKAAASMYSGMYHTVKKGQTLYDISMTYYGNSLMVDRIMQLNSIDDEFHIKEGQRILLP